MHSSSDVIASETENFRHSGETTLAAAADVKRELKMEVDSSETAWYNEGYDIRSADEIEPRIRNAAPTGAQADGEPPRLVSGHTASRDPWYPDVDRSSGDVAASNIEIGSDTTGTGSYRTEVSSRSDRTESRNVTGRPEWNAESIRNGEVEPSLCSSTANGLTVVGRPSVSRNRCDELILSTPFGLFHRASLSFWPARNGAGEQSTGASHTSTPVAGSAPDNQSIYCHERCSVTDRDVCQSVAADRRRDVPTLPAVIAQGFLSSPGKPLK